MQAGRGPDKSEKAARLDASRSLLYETATFRTCRARCGAISRREPALCDRIPKMARRCELTGKGVMTGNRVSHALNRTRRRFLPNLLNVTLISDTLGRSVKLRISANALRSVEHRGGLDAFLLKAGDDELSANALGLKREIRAALAA